jgi:SAM-dependent methyltransferase
MTARPPVDSSSSRPYFDDLATLYERFVRALDDDSNPIRQALGRHLTGGTRLLDVGAGVGQNSRWLAPRYEHVLAVDIAPRMVEIARARPHPANVEFACRDGMDLDPDTDGRFDGVLALNTVFHMGEVDVVLPHLRDLVAPGGTLVVVDVVRPDDLPSPGPAGTALTDQQRRYAFDTARAVHEMTGDVEAVIDSIRLMLHPRWLEMSAEHVPLTASGFRRSYGRHLPGVVIADQVVPELAMAVWRAPAHAPATL